MLLLAVLGLITGLSCLLYLFLRIFIRNKVRLRQGVVLGIYGFCMYWFIMVFVNILSDSSYNAQNIRQYTQYVMRQMETIIDNIHYMFAEDADVANVISIALLELMGPLCAFILPFFLPFRRADSDESVEWFHYPTNLLFTALLASCILLVEFLILIMLSPFFVEIPISGLLAVFILFACLGASPIGLVVIILDR